MKPNKQPSLRLTLIRYYYKLKGVRYKAYLGLGIRSIFFTPGRSVGERLHIWRCRQQAQYVVSYDGTSSTSVIRIASGWVFDRSLSTTFYLVAQYQVGNTFTFDVVGRKRVRISLRTLLLQKRLRVRPYKHVSPWLLSYLNEAGSQCKAVTVPTPQTSRRLEGGRMF